MNTSWHLGATLGLSSLGPWILWFVFLSFFLISFLLIASAGADVDPAV